MDTGAADRAGRIAQLSKLIAELAAVLSEDEAPRSPLVEHTVLLDVAEAARLLGVSRATLYSGPIKRGELHTVFIGSRRLVPRRALDEFVASLAGRAS